MSYNDAPNYAKTFTSIAGVDITPMIGSKVIGTLQQITIMVNREKAGWWALGRVNPRGIARGKRAIAGTLNFLDINQHALLSHMDTAYYGYINEHHAGADDTGSDNLSKLSLSGLYSYSEQEQLDTALFATNQSVGFNKQWLRPTHADQIPPFDIVLSAANEMGVRARLVLFGVEILNDGIGVSIDDLVMEQQLQFIALDMIPWTLVDQVAPPASAFANAAAKIGGAHY